MMQQKVRTCLWFDDQAKPAAEFYVDLLPDSSIESVRHYPSKDGEEPKVLLVEFTLSGAPYQALNGGPHFKLTESVSISVLTDSQDETDYLWDSLIADGGSESQCGWLKDRFGLSWQIVPKKCVELMSGPQVNEVWAVLQNMKKIEIAALEEAANS